MFCKIKVFIGMMLCILTYAAQAQSVTRTGGNCVGDVQTFSFSCWNCIFNGASAGGSHTAITPSGSGGLVSISFAWTSAVSLGANQVSIAYRYPDPQNQGSFLNTSTSYASSITINAPTPVVINSLTASPSGTIVAGTPVTFTATGGDYLTYSFKVKGVEQQTGSSKTFTYSQFNNGDDVSVTASYAGCYAPTTISMIMSVIPVPPPTLPTVSANTCGPRTVTASANQYGVYWQGTTQNGTSTVSNIAGTSVIISQPGTYYVNSKNNSAWSADVPVVIAIDAVDHSVSAYVNELEQASYKLSLKPGFSVPAGKAFTGRIAISDECNDYINWVEQIVYDENGNPVSRGRTYFDGLQNPLQSQSIDFGSGKVWATQPLYDNLGKAAGGSLPAPILENDFIYKKKFITNNATPAVAYSPNDFDKPISGNLPGEINNPVPVGKDAGTLGWYYSTNNTLEPNTPVTNFPYARSYAAPGPNPLAAKTASVGDQYKMGSGHEVTDEKQKITTADLVHYYALKPHFSTTPTNNLVPYFADADAATLEGFNGPNLNTTILNGETYVTSTSSGVNSPGLYPIGSTTTAYTVVPGSSYTLRIQGYSEGTGYACLYARQGLSGADILWIGSPLGSGQVNQTWTQNTFTIPAGVTSISIGVRWNTTTAGSKIFLNKVQLYKVGGDLPEGYKIISTDPNGKKMVSFVDTEGKTLATALLTGAAYSNWSYTYYNEMGQVVATVAPKGVDTNVTTMPQFVTWYKYDHLGRLIETTSTDEGTSRFVYSLDGKIRFSESQEQRNASPKRFSYTNYDYLGRAIEAGEYTSNGTTPYIFEPHSTSTPSAQSVLGLTESIGFADLSRKVSIQASRCSDYSFIEYDRQGSNFVANGTHTAQTNTFGQVTKTENENASTWYSYDEFGQLLWSMQNITGLGIKTADYTYNYFGNVTQVMYAGTTASDKFYHHYEYDVSQQLTTVYTSTDGVTKSLQAKYYYYQHGPLKRVELGNKIQGIDYVYNIDGSLKLINNADPTLDPGQDGISGANAGFMKDIFGETLDYNTNDYDGAAYTEGNATATTSQHFNGLLQAVRWHSAVDTHVKRAYAFTYDERYQLDNAEWGNVSGTGTSTFTPSPLQAYKEDVTGYDKNGNIGGMIRKGKTGNTLANYTYNYQTNTNKLTSVTGGASPINYQYNSIGQMTQQSEGANTMKVSYNVSGLVKEIRNASNALTASYYYDDRGALVHKIYYNNGAIAKHAYYVSDVSGNSMAIYEQDVANNIALKLTELPIYGGGRVAVYKPVFATVLYEVSDHLGNVRGVVGNPLPLEFKATLEDNDTANFRNPRVQEMAYFENLSATQVQDANMNHSPASPAMPVPKYSAYLKWISGMSGQDAAQKSVGPAINLKVEAGDKLDIETWVKYKKKQGPYNRSGIIGAMASILGTSYVGSAPGLDVLANATQVFQGGITSVIGSLTGNNDQTIPYAYVYCLVYDRNFNLIAQKSTATRVTTNGGFDAGYEALSTHGQLVIPQITITEPGYAYIFVANESENTEVWFDDLKINEQRSSIVAGSDYYPFGLAMEGREITREDYRYGYQGQYSEKDKTTGWNEFELRMYDPRIGRWLSVDPYGQFASPYLAMGNNPMINVDPNGGFVPDPVTMLDDVVIATATRLPSYVISTTALKTFTMGAYYYSVRYGHTGEFHPTDAPSRLSQMGDALWGAVLRNTDLFNGFFQASGLPVPDYSSNLPGASDRHTLGFRFGVGVQLMNLKYGGGGSEVSYVPSSGNSLIIQPATAPVMPVTRVSDIYGRVHANGALKSFGDIVTNPKALWGKSAGEVGNILGEGWTKGTYGSKGTGWKFTKGDQSVFYHPGGGRHGGSYYGFSSGKLGKNKIVGSDYVPLAGDKANIIKIID